MILIGCCVRIIKIYYARDACNCNLLFVSLYVIHFYELKIEKWNKQKIEGKGYFNLLTEVNASKEAKKLREEVEINRLFDYLFERRINNHQI